MFQFRRLDGQDGHGGGHGGGGRGTRRRRGCIQMLQRSRDQGTGGCTEAGLALGGVENWGGAEMLCPIIFAIN